MDKDEAAKKIREAAQAGRIEFAPQYGIEQMQAECDGLMNLLEIEGAWVSDHSSIDDFSCMATPRSREQNYEKINEHYGIGVSHETHPYVIDVLREIVKSQGIGHA